MVYGPPGANLLSQGRRPFPDLKMAGKRNKKMAGNSNSGGREFELEFLLLALEPLDGQPRLPELLGQSLAWGLRVNLLLFQN